MTAVDPEGRIRHPLDVFHSTYQPDGSFVAAGYVPVADGAGLVDYVDSATIGGSPFIDVTQSPYNAAGDDTTDDTTAIQTAFDDYPNGATIYFPPGTYKITATINISGKHYRVLGAGTRYGPSVIHMTTTNTTALSFVTTGLSGFRIETSLVEKLDIKGPHSSSSLASSGRGVYASSDVFCSEVMVTGFYDGFYWAGTTYYSYARDCFATNCNHAGYVLDNTNNCILDNCRAIGQYSSTLPLGTMQYGVVILGGGSIGLLNRVQGGSIEYFSKSGVYVDGGGPVTIYKVYFETQQSSSGFAHIEAGASSEVRALSIIDNYLQGDGTSGFNAIKLGKVNTFHIHGCRFGINGAIGITSTADTSGGFVWGNYNSPSGTFTLPADTITSPGGSLGTPALTLGTANSAGTATTAVRTDATILAFDATVPVTQAFGDTAATGSATVAARRDHRHGMPATPTGGGQILISDTPAGSPLVFSDLIQNEAGTDLVYAD